MVKVRTKLILVVAVALCALAAAGTAAAEETNIFSASPLGNTSLASLGSITFETSALSITCPLTLNGTFERYVMMESGAGFGEITRASAGRCNTGTLTMDTTNPWILAYRSFLGTLPSSVTGLLFRIRDASFLFTVTIFGLTARCEYYGDIGALVTTSGRGPFTTGLISLLSGEDSFTLDRSLDTSGVCPAAESFSAAGRLSLAAQQTLTQQTLGFRAVPASHDFGNANGERDFTFRNISGAGIEVTRFELQYGNRGFSIVSHECLMADGRPKTIAADGICRVRIRFVSGGANARIRYDRVQLSSGAGGTTLSGAISLEGR